MNHLLSVLLAVFLFVGLMAPVPTTAAPTVSALRISQVYGGGGNTGATYTNDFIEIFNGSMTTVSLAGHSVQYASAAGDSWQVTALSGSLAPGQYYLIQEAQGAGGTVSLPPPDATGSIPMSLSSGKVALVNSTTALTVSCPTAGVVDFVGYGGSANCFEVAPTATLDNTIAALRLGNGCTDTDNNGADFTADAPNPRNTASTTNACGPTDAAPAVASVDPLPGAADVPIGANISITFSEAVSVTGSWYGISCATSGAHTAAVTGGPVTFALDPDSDFGPGELCTVTVFAAQVSDQDTDDPPDNPVGNYVWALMTASPAAPAMIINELDADTPGTDAAEFVELYDGGVGSTSLDGLAIVFYNGATDLSYVAIDLDGHVTDAGGYFLLGNAALAPDIAFADNTLQNGQDAVALYQGDAVDFPVGAAVTTVNLVDAIVYDTSDEDDAGLLVLLNAGQPQVDENATGASAAESSQRCPNGAGGARDTDTYAQFAPTPRTANLCAAADAPPAVAITAPANATMNVPVNSDVSITFSEPVTIAEGWHSISCTTSGEHTATVTGGPTTWALNPDVDFAAGEVCTVTVYASQVLDQDTEDPPDAMTADYAWSFTIAATDICDDPYTAIYDVQGSGPASPLVDTTVAIEGVVVGDFQGATGLNGYYLQDPAGDGDPATSDGIFVYVPTANPFAGVDVQVGDELHLSGTVKEYNGVTELDNLTELKICGAGVVAPTTVDLPETTNGDLERYEGMLLTFPETLTVSQNYFQGRYGQVTLSSEGRMYNPTNGNGLGDTFDLNARRILVLDDGYSGQNPSPIPYIGEDDTLRAGDTVIGLTGTLDYGPINATSPYIYDYRLQPTEPVTFTRANARPAVPDAVGGNVKVASFNVLNYFTTFGSRGANNQEEFDRQRAKIITALQAIDADVVGLMEIENNGAAIADLVAGLNAAMGAGAYAYVVEPAPGADEIKVALIYKPAAVSPAGAAQNYQISTAEYDPLFDRPPLAQTFTVLATGEEFTVVVNHFKSKGSCPDSGVDADQGDGQGCWNSKRVAQAAGLLGFTAQLQTLSGDEDVLVIGDLNAYGAEDPINTLIAGGLIDEVSQVPAAQRYTYIFDGLSGYLDHGLATPSLAAQVSGRTLWHINADEPSVIDYNTEFKPQDLYAPTPYRSSDHDPVILGLQLGARRVFLPLVVKSEW